MRETNKCFFCEDEIKPTTKPMPLCRSCNGWNTKQYKTWPKADNSAALVETAKKTKQGLLRA
jgi:hypothetical protein